MNLPRNISQGLKEQKESESRRTLLTHREMLNSINNNPMKLLNATSSLKKMQMMNSELQLTKVESRPSIQQNKDFKRAQGKSMRERMIEKRYMHRQALFMNKHNHAEQLHQIIEKNPSKVQEALAAQKPQLLLKNELRKTITNNKPRNNPWP